MCFAMVLALDDRMPEWVHQSEISDSLLPGSAVRMEKPPHHHAPFDFIERLLGLNPPALSLSGRKCWIVVVLLCFSTYKVCDIMQPQ